MPLGKMQMKCRTSITRVLGFMLAFGAAANAADAPPLTFKFTAANVPGALQTGPGGINNSGVMVGTYQDKSFAWHGYILNGKKLTKLDDPNGTSTYPFSLNPNGDIAVVGNYRHSGGTVGFLYKNGKFIDVPGPTGARASYATGINDSGEIVGTYFDSNSHEHGFLLKGKTYKTLDVPGSTATIGSGINNHGTVVLFWLDSRAITRSSLYNGKTYKTIDVPGAQQSQAQGLNNEGDVIYEWFDSSNVAHGALLHARKYYKFDHPRSVQTFAVGINDRHVIVGAYQTTANGLYQGFKATY
jgi:uncharacterized membrane protein